MGINEKYIDKFNWTINERGYADATLTIKIPSVSAILGTIPDPELDAWKEAVGIEKAEEIMQNAAYRGTSMHLFLENYIKKLAETGDKSNAMQYSLLESSKELLNEHIDKKFIDEGRSMFYDFYYNDISNKFNNVISTEMKLYSKTYLFRGAIDIVYDNNKLCISDYKSASSKLKQGSLKHKKYLLQLGAYALLYEDTFENTKVEECSNIVITKNGIIEEISVNGDKLDIYKTAFINLCVKWHKDNNQSFLFDN